MKGVFFVAKSITIKSNDLKFINYLLTGIKKLPTDKTFFSCKKFKNYYNVIVHYTGMDIPNFILYLSSTITHCIINIYELSIIKNTIKTNYFYFSSIEQSQILENCIQNLKDSTNEYVCIRESHVQTALTEYLQENKVLIIDGFINFRISNYLKLINYIVDTSVEKFVIDREYSEFIALLKQYIFSHPCKSSCIHVIYSMESSFLLDEKQELIPFDNQVFNQKYLSDIHFSSNDYTLNTLLTFLPEKIFIHTNDVNDDFINTLKLIFDKRVSFCNSCELCNSFKDKDVYLFNKDI